MELEYSLQVSENAEISDLVKNPSSGNQLAS
jgi:hypothetical protein